MGPEGDRGITAIQGYRGVQGSRGEKGDSGAIGPRGQKGDQVSIGVQWLCRVPGYRNCSFFRFQLPVNDF